MINVKYLNELYNDLLNILQNSHTLRQESLDKMYDEQRNSKKVKAILDYWDLFEDAQSDDPNIDYKYNRDYLWDKIHNDIPYEDKLDSLDTDNDDDVDKTDVDKIDVGNIAKSIAAYDVGRTFDDN